MYPIAPAMVAGIRKSLREPRKGGSIGPFTSGSVDRKRNRGMSSARPECLASRSQRFLDILRGQFAAKPYSMNNPVNPGFQGYPGQFPLVRPTPRTNAVKIVLAVIAGMFALLLGL